MNNTETELKLALSNREYAAILSAAEVTRQRVIYNHYFYCDGMSPDEMVRIRQVDSAYGFCRKRRLSDEDGVFVSDEYDVGITAEQACQFIGCGISAEQLSQLTGEQQNRSLRYVGCLVTVRVDATLKSFHMEMDCASYLGSTDYELECEDAAPRLEELRTLLKDMGIFVSPSMPKSRRFLEKLASIPMPL